MATLARYAKPILLLDSSLLLAGVLLTSFNMLLVGWSVYAVGHVLAILAFLAVGALYRSRMDGWSWAGLLVLEVGLILALPQVARIWQSCTLTPTQAPMLLPSQTDPIGLAAQTITWVGLAFFGLAARGARALPRGVGWIFVVASSLGLLADFVHVWPLTQLWWVPAMLVMSFGLIALGASVATEAESPTERASELPATS